MRVLVLGGTVFIGRAIVTELVGPNHVVCIVHRGQHEPDDLPRCLHVHVDRSELASVRGEIDDFGPDAVVDIVAGTASDTEQTLAALPDGPRLYVISSMDVYRAYGALHAGEMSEPVPIDETSPVRADRSRIADKETRGSTTTRSSTSRSATSSAEQPSCGCPWCTGPTTTSVARSLFCGAYAPDASRSPWAPVRGWGRRGSSPTSRAESVSPSSRTRSVARSSTSASRAPTRWVSGCA